MALPFTRPEFLQVFADYNEGIWPLQVVAGLLGVIALASLFSNSRIADRVIAGILAVLWSVTGIGYHWLFFSSISPAAYIFGALFLIAACIFLVEGTVRNRIRFRFVRGIRGWAALLVLTYSLIVYPLMGLAITHPYPETPLFGVAPCPTVIFSLGLLLLAAYRRPLLLAAVPLLWAGIGGSAAFLLGVPQDLGLLVAALIWLAGWIHQRLVIRQPTTGRAPGQ
ncbi:MAG: DUF6064 family protein [Woeseiaceae bacterium]|jgi:hypothetical protein|nr:DUF6064 family protein [Woeseiaceae bacterium]